MSLGGFVKHKACLTMAKVQCEKWRLKEEKWEDERRKRVWRQNRKCRRRETTRRGKDAGLQLCKSNKISSKTVRECLKKMMQTNVLE